MSVVQESKQERKYKYQNFKSLIVVLLNCDNEYLENKLLKTKEAAIEYRESIGKYLIKEIKKKSQETSEQKENNRERIIYLLNDIIQSDQKFVPLVEQELPDIYSNIYNSFLGPNRQNDQDTLDTMKFILKIWVAHFSDETILNVKTKVPNDDLDEGFQQEQIENLENYYKEKNLAHFRVKQHLPRIRKPQPSIYSSTFLMLNNKSKQSQQQAPPTPAPAPAPTPATTTNNNITEFQYSQPHQPQPQPQPQQPQNIQYQQQQKHQSQQQQAQKQALLAQKQKLKEDRILKKKQQLQKQQSSASSQSGGYQTNNSNVNNINSSNPVNLIPPPPPANQQQQQPSIFQQLQTQSPQLKKKPKKRSSQQQEYQQHGSKQSDKQYQEIQQQKQNQLDEDRKKLAKLQKEQIEKSNLDSQGDVKIFKKDNSKKKTIQEIQQQQKQLVQQQKQDKQQLQQQQQQDQQSKQQQQQSTPQKQTQDILNKYLSQDQQAQNQFTKKSIDINNSQQLQQDQLNKKKEKKIQQKQDQNTQNIEKQYPNNNNSSQNNQPTKSATLNSLLDLNPKNFPQDNIIINQQKNYQKLQRRSDNQSQQQQQQQQQKQQQLQQQFSPIDSPIREPNNSNKTTDILKDNKQSGDKNNINTQQLNKEQSAKQPIQQQKQQQIVQPQPVSQPPQQQQQQQSQSQQKELYTPINSLHDIKYKEDNFVQKNEGWDHIEEDNGSMEVENNNEQNNGTEQINQSSNPLGQLVAQVPIVQDPQSNFNSQVPSNIPQEEDVYKNSFQNQKKTQVSQKSQYNNKNLDSSQQQQQPSQIKNQSNNFNGNNNRQNQFYTDNNYQNNNNNNNSGGNQNMRNNQFNTQPSKYKQYDNNNNNSQNNNFNNQNQNFNQQQQQQQLPPIPQKQGIPLYPPVNEYNDGYNIKKKNRNNQYGNNNNNNNNNYYDQYNNSNQYRQQFGQQQQHGQFQQQNDGANDQLMFYKVLKNYQYNHFKMINQSRFISYIDSQKSDVINMQDFKKNIYIVDTLYKDLPYQCSNCGQRFQDKEIIKQHYDWHFQQNFVTLLYQQKQLKIPRKNLLNVDDWINGEQNSKSAQTEQESEKKKDNKFYIEAQLIETNKCELCQEDMKLIWDEKLEKWVYIDCVLTQIEETDLENKSSTCSLHYNCYNILYQQQLWEQEHIQLQEQEQDSIEQEQQQQQQQIDKIDQNVQQQQQQLQEQKA